MTVEILGGNLVEVTVEPSPVVEVEVYPGGVVNTGSIDLSDRYQLILNRFTGNPQLYKELSYTGDNLTKIEAWNSSAKVTKYYTVDLSYTGTNLTGKTLTDNINGDVLTVTYSYTGENLTSISEVFS